MFFPLAGRFQRRVRGLGGGSSLAFWRGSGFGWCSHFARRLEGVSHWLPEYPLAVCRGLIGGETTDPQRDPHWSQWSQTIPIGPQWSQNVPKDTHWSPLDPNGPKGSPLIANGPTGSPLIPNGTERSPLVSFGPKWSQRFPKDHHWFPMVPKEPYWSPMVPRIPKSRQWHQKDLDVRF